ncbi:putative membrane anchor opy2 [Phaeomoniella chlamydospora]|uniref:Putative membrane anchor opy2 n=1 Tax=Phaeomoniella chlamydospora TaxID=158046 RepID=A0A0G2EGS0_PHACM|nr:putative membrane anchor opy2 [Phaeomoniella chlamydospora]
MDFAGHQLFRRCVQCPSETPSCPSCASDETCTLIASSCDSCASTICSKVSESSTEHKKSAPAGAIAGAVIGGVFVIALAVFLVWRFFIRDRRKQWDAQPWTNVDDGFEKRSTIGQHREARQSVRSVHSIASTVLTRASNVIQIAYIPGVTNRSPPDTPGTLVPPVPPLPLATVNSTATSPSFDQEQHFFLPGDIRDSTWSGYSDMTRASISPSLARSSVATTIYRNNAIVSPIPAQQALRGRAAVVSVKSGSTTPTLAESQRTVTPPMPANAAQIAMSGSSIVARTMVPKPIQVKKSNSGTSIPTLANLKAKAAENKSPPARLETSDETSSNEVDPKQNRKSVIANERSGRRSDAVTVIEDSPAQGGLNSTARASSSGTNHGHKKSESLQFLIEEAMNRAAKDPRQATLDNTNETEKKDGGPFSDANELKENL